jgi:hypothetical protein
MLLRGGKVVDKGPLLIFQYAQKALRNCKCVKVTQIPKGALIKYATMPIVCELTTMPPNDMIDIFTQLTYATYLEYQYAQYRHPIEQCYDLQVRVDAESGDIIVSSDANQYKEKFQWQGESKTDAQIQASIRQHCPYMEMSFYHPINDHS